MQANEKQILHFDETQQSRELRNHCQRIADLPLIHFLLLYRWLITTSKKEDSLAFVNRS